jgi:D-glycero-alpha-D-manno-heptose 1-phosphate guanylyltransferase
MQITTAIILAGGLGTRLRSVVSDLPKCMAPVNQKPFLDYVIEYLQQQGITHFIFSVGYKAASIIQHIHANYPDLKTSFAIEESPLGTGGAILYACQYATESNVIIVNGDTIFKANLQTLVDTHINNHSECTLSLKPMHHFERYGVVTTNEQNQITGFKEKQYYESGMINGGVYVLNIPKFKAHELPTIFSFEKNYLETHYAKGSFYGYISEGYFIDIGIPEDFSKAQYELK